MRLKDVVHSDFYKKVNNKGIVYRDVTLGGDPEFFVADKTGRILPSDHFFPGKHNPIILSSDRTKSLNKDGQNKVFFDGIQGEINPAAQKCRDYLNINIKELLLEVSSRIGDNKVVLKPSVRVLKKTLEVADPEAKVFGCMPDFNAYTLTTNTCEMDASKHFYRYAGGHIHLGISSVYTKSNDPEYAMVHNEENHIRIIKFMDVMVGVLSVLLDRGKDAKRRRTKYGKAGCFRPTPYGVEYRTPSCWWLKSPMLSSLVYGLARMCWVMILNNIDEEFRALVGADDETVRGICDESDIRAAKKLWKNMRPFIAVVGKRAWNPIHISNYYGRYGKHNSSALAKLAEHCSTMGVPPYAALEENKITFSLPVLDYIINNGLDSVISDDIKEEWGLTIPEACCQGFMITAHRKLSKNRDFLNFQRNYYKGV